MSCQVNDFTVQALVGRGLDGGRKKVDGSHYAEGRGCRRLVHPTLLYRSYTVADQIESNMYTPESMQAWSEEEALGQGKTLERDTMHNSLKPLSRRATHVDFGPHRDKPRGRDFHEQVESGVCCGNVPSTTVEHGAGVAVERL